MLKWFQAVVYAAVTYVLAMSLAKALMGAPFDPVSVAGSIFLLLILPVLYKLASRRSKERPETLEPKPKRKR